MSENNKNNKKKANSADGGKKNAKPANKTGAGSGGKKSANKTERAMRSLGVARRSIWYILRTVLIIALCIVVCYGAFIEAMYVSNIYIIVTEGMELRADCILGNTPEMELREHFYEGWLLEDPGLMTGKYDSYRVDSYDYRLSIEKFKVYPWSKKATLVVIEKVVNIQAAPYSDDITDPIPEWVSTRMEIELEKISGRWYITKLTVLETNPETEPRPTPDYNKLETDIPHY